MCNSLAKRFFMLGIIMVSFVNHAQDELNDGPGILSGEKGQFSLSELFAKKEQIDEKTDEKILTTLVNTTDTQEFDLFKKWTQSKSENDVTYQEFRLWLKYQEYSQQQTKGK